MAETDVPRLPLPLKTERLLLRPYFAEDADAFYAYMSDPEVTRFEPYPPMTPKQAEDELLRRTQNPDFIAVCTPPDKVHLYGALIGHIFFTPCAFGTWELGYMLHRAYWHRGYASEAARAVIDTVFREGLAHRVIAMCNPENTASERLMQRLGMRKEGHLRQNLYFQTTPDGAPVWLDTVMYAVLKDEWFPHR